MRWPKAGPPGRHATLLASAVALGLVAGVTAARAEKWGPENTITVVDPSPVNWLSITWNTMEEAVRVDKDGKLTPTLAESWTWVDDKTLELKLRKNVVFQDGEKFTAKLFKVAFDKAQGWENPHPPGAWLNYAKKAEVTIVDDNTVRFEFPASDGAVFMKLRGMHVGSTAFWAKLGFVDERTKSADGHW